MPVIRYYKRVPVKFSKYIVEDSDDYYHDELVLNSDDIRVALGYVDAYSFYEDVNYSIIPARSKKWKDVKKIFSEYWADIAFGNKGIYLMKRRSYYDELPLELPETEQLKRSISVVTLYTIRALARLCSISRSPHAKDFFWWVMKNEVNLSPAEDKDLLPIEGKWMYVFQMLTGRKPTQEDHQRLICGKNNDSNGQLDLLDNK